MSLAKLISVARGDAPADLLLKNAKIINTFVGIIEEGNVAIYGDRIAGIGNYVKAKEVIDLKGIYLAPGLINGHTHIESSMLHPAQYAQAVVPRGTSTVITDLHEITNVAGFDGIKFVMNWVQKLPLDMFFVAPSCVPATHMETSGAEINAQDIKKILGMKNFIGLGEMMNFPGVISGDREVLKKIAVSQGKVIDGHAPGVTNKRLNAYLAAGIGSDHESTTLEEGREKLRRGMHLMIREGSSEKNLDALLPLVNDRTYNRCLFVVDDRSCSDLLHEGDIDAVVRKAIQNGLEPVRAIQLATMNTAEYFRLYDRGGIAPGYIANLITITDLPNLEIHMVFYKGHLVARNGKYLEAPLKASNNELTDTVRIKPFGIEALKLTTSGKSFPVIEIIPGQIITKKRIEMVKAKDGVIMPDLEEDILKLVVVERHKSSGNIGLGLIKGFGLKRGALASSIAHDSHNIVAVGTNDHDIFTVIKEIEKLQGGLAVCVDGKILAALPLPVAGLLSTEPLETVVKKFEKLEKTASGLGHVPPAPFALLSFIALPVIPELRLTDMGLVDVLEFKLINTP
ncbi:MAG: adenine deaminase [Chloroflexi bacterium RBG_19FT_COMBO_48_23]|nr:MAG: adenine deaminase [Chloroflexi bacterium RBG_19FT_COMBO_48_23]